MARKTPTMRHVNSDDANSLDHNGITPESVKRRQSSSCDQCRQGKRACDAGRTVLAATARDKDEDEEDVMLKNEDERQKPRCTYCQRTRKQCTFKWLLSVRRKKRESKSRQPSLRKLSRKSDSIDSNGAQLDESSQNSTQDSASWLSSSSEQGEAGTDLDGFDVVVSNDVLNHSPGSEWTAFDDVCYQDTKSTITKSLMTVYRDSMENALDCWLTESNCPYTSPVQPQAESFSGIGGACRILQRVCKLDKDLTFLSAINSSTSEQRQASKALRLSMMSFATQWSQSGPRELLPYKMKPSASQRKVFHPNITDWERDESFGRAMQESLWHQARKALREAEGIVSSRVTFAFIIFSLTQPPLTSPRQLVNTDSTSDRLTRLEGPPLFLESAMRQLSKMRRLIRRSGIGNGYSRTSGPSNLDRESRNTFELLFWLGIMFDTLSAAMHDRAVVVADDDCEPIAAQILPEEVDLDGLDFSSATDPVPDEERLENTLWDRKLLESPQLETDPVVWPCTFNTAEKILRDAAPVKVLLFRKVAQIQALMSRLAIGPRLERAIDNFLAVYSHWQAKYQPFMDSCLQSHESLPPKLQSWYGILSAHWHLAAMIFAEIVQQVDDLRLSSPTKLLARKRSSFIRSWRFEHSFAIGGLAEAALHADNASFAQTPMFHDALNKSSLLCEPWTAVLVRTFSKAATFLLENINPRNTDERTQKLRHNARRCIEVLLLMGKKSDIALLVGESLQEKFLDEGRSFGNLVLHGV